ncbi:LOW QUALITY PROTEIN: immunity-related GTPase family M protein [Peromyscus eremicus]|uniref:LOW QUALITY PROTEIN: immunity-related GTPase family M protein n=1 Tax=Peromyscus eremicus TaxID=42410 RepID=UPI0027DC6DD4|nr:LOW QUALITY PROTEIN: immunity-related GTPase family M protein [Peromyscus eremicus]
MSQLFSDIFKDEDICSSFIGYFKTNKAENGIISQKTITSIKLHLAQGNIQKASAVITDALREISRTPLNIAVIGESGTGKSSFINAFRGVGHEEEESAPIGVVETTMRRTPYRHPNIPDVVIWDLPGIGTTNFPPKDYLKKMKFNEYDFFIIVSATHFRKNDIDLAKAVSMMKKDFYFMRTKVDRDLEFEKGCKHTFNRVKLLQHIRSYYENNFKEINLDVPPIFLISNKNLSDYDFPILKDLLKNKLSTHTLQNFMNSLPNITEAAIDRKHKAMQQTNWLEAVKPGTLATVPVEGILKDKDAERLKASLNHFRVLFGVDDESLEFIAKASQVPVAQLKEIIKSPYLLETKKEKTFGEKFLKYLEKFASAKGGSLATGLYFRKTFYFQLFFLDTVTEDAKVLLRETYLRN